MTTDLRATTIEISGHNGDQIEAYFAEPLTDDATGGVVVIHHMPGYDRESREIVRRFADAGYLAICPNLYSREGGPGVSYDDAAAAARAKGGVPDDRLVGDVKGAVEFLRSRPTSNGRVGTIGYCSGGRQSVLAACSLQVDAAVDCYGAFVMVDPPEGAPLKVTSLVDKLPNLSCPLLGLFGADDSYPSPEQNEALREALAAHHKSFEMHTYEGAGHAFFSVDRTAYRPEAAIDGWQKIWAFYGEHLRKS